MYGRIALLILLIFIYVHWEKFWDPWMGLVEVTARSGRKYRVRKDSAEQAVELMDEMWGNLIALVDGILASTPQNEDDTQNRRYVERIKSRLDTVKVRETEKSSPYTSYSINKGQELVFCMRSKAKDRVGAFHDVNDLMYVGIHEIAHIGSPEVGHTKLFRDINKYLLKKASEAGLYKVENYNANPKEYCGIQITTNMLL